LAPTDIRLERGQWLGIDGPSGAGKTTLADLVAGLLPSNLAVDGRALEGETLERWAASLAYVGQEGSLFDDSVRGNLLADGATASDEQLWGALDAVGLSDRIRALPAGLDERIGDRGTRLSGGEAQRLALARAWLRGASLWILDEATAALDAASEARLIERLRALDPRPAAIVIAHRQSTLAYCDSVLTIQHRPEEKAAS
jgi:ATP-binding cassette subfamily C protein